jgi:hypothetical protein
VAEERGEARGWVRRGVDLAAIVLLLSGALGISTAFGMLLLLPLYVRELGGDEADFGVILSSAAIPAVLCIGLLLRYPERLRSHAVVAIAIAVYAVGAVGASVVDASWEPLVGVGVLLGTAWAVVYAASPMVISPVRSHHSISCAPVLTSDIPSVRVEPAVERCSRGAGESA